MKCYGREITAIRAELRSIDGERLIETLEVQDYRKEEEQIRGRLALKDLIEKKQEYMLTILLEMEGWDEVRYITHVIWDPESDLKAHLDYVQDFHDRLYHREEARELVKYLESNSKLESNKSFHKVNIHSSFKQITYGDMKVKERTKPVITVREIGSQYATILLDYHVTVAGSDGEMLCRMQEYYRLRHTADRMYLLAYERTMTQIPDETGFLAGDKILLGIGDENVKMMESPNGSVLAFEQADRLFAFRSSDQKIVHIFSFYDGTLEDERDYIDKHDIKILRVEDDGCVDFAVYGYMNRGDHEGNVGIRICHYDAEVNTISETAFLSWDSSYDTLQTEMEELLYLGDQDKLYLVLGNAVYEVNLLNRGYGKIFDILWDGCMKVSEDNSIIVWQKDMENGYSDELEIWDLQLNARSKVRGKSGEALRALGFMGHDIIYGVAYKTNLSRLSTGKLFFPMHKIVIAGADGIGLKEYEQENIFVTECSIEENQIVLDRMVKRDDGSFAQTGQDHITKNQQTGSGKNRVAVVDIDTYERYVQIQLTGKIDATKLQRLTPKEVVREGNDDISIEIASGKQLYYVCGPYGIAQIDTEIGNAVEAANELSGTVLSENGSIIWQKGRRAARNQIMSIKQPQKCEVSESLAVCIDTLLLSRGITVDSAELLGNGAIAADIISEKMADASVIDMTGCSLDAMLYYVNQDIPVLALLDGGEAVLITGFNESQVVIFRPAEGKLQKRGMSDAAKWFEENGNTFLTYLLARD